MSEIKSMDGGPALKARIARSANRATGAMDTLTCDSFDADRWMALLAEQTMRIASAAGVDPSKVKIRIGH